MTLTAPFSSRRPTGGLVLIICITLDIHNNPLNRTLNQRCCKRKKKIKSNLLLADELSRQDSYSTVTSTARISGFFVSLEKQLYLHDIDNMKYRQDTKIVYFTPKKINPMTRMTLS